MIIENTGWISDELYVLGTLEMPVYFLDAEKPVLLDAGFSCLGKLYVNELKRVTDKVPSYCLLTHVHFDHCGSVSVFKENFTGISVCCSQKGSEILQKPNAVKLIRELNSEAKKYIGKQVENTRDMEDFQDFEVDCLLKENDCLQISSDLSVQVLETPGHTRDHVCYYIPERKILFSGEALGISNTRGYIHTESLADFDLYMHSLDKLRKLDVEVLCLGHNYVYTGSDARKFFDAAKSHSLEFRDWVDACMKEENEDIDKVMQIIKSREYDPEPHPKQPEGAYMLNLRAKIEAIWNRKGMQ